MLLSSSAVGPPNMRFRASPPLPSWRRSSRRATRSCPSGSIEKGGGTPPTRPSIRSEPKGRKWSSRSRRGSFGLPEARSSSMWPFPSSTVPTGRTERSRACSRWRGSPTSVPGSSDRPLPWTRTSPSGSSERPASRSLPSSSCGVPGSRRIPPAPSTSSSTRSGSPSSPNRPPWDPRSGSVEPPTPRASRMPSRKRSGTARKPSSSPRSPAGRSKSPCSKVPGPRFPARSSCAAVGTPIRPSTRTTPPS